MLKEDLNKLHWTRLKTMCQQAGHDITHVSGKEAYIKLLTGNDMQTESNQLPPNTTTLPLITAATLEDLKSVGISKSKIMIDKVKSDLDALVWRGKKGERRFNDGKHYYHIDTNDNTVHFLGGCLGPICQTLACPEGFVARMGARYLMANTVAGVDGMKELVN